MALQNVPSTGIDQAIAKMLTLIQDNVSKALIPLQNSPLSGGELLFTRDPNGKAISGISLKAGQDNIVQHSLGFVPSIIMIGVPDANSTIWNPSTTALLNRSATNKSINLWCSADCHVAVWVNG